jgi:hypothetical protein
MFWRAQTPKHPRTQHWALLTPLISFLGVAMGVMIIVSMLLTTIQKLTKIR